MDGGKKNHVLEFVGKEGKELKIDYLNKLNNF